MEQAQRLLVDARDVEHRDLGDRRGLAVGAGAALALGGLAARDRALVVDAVRGDAERAHQQAFGQPPQDEHVEGVDQAAGELERGVVVAHRQRADEREWHQPERQPHEHAQR